MDSCIEIRGVTKRFGDFAAVDRVESLMGAGVAGRLRADGAREAWQLNCQVMTMHRDVPVGLDDPTHGSLPLAPALVAEVFGSFNLTWTAAQAVRVLADADPEEHRPPRPEPQQWTQAPRRRRWTPQPVRPRTEQLALF